MATRSREQGFGFRIRQCERRRTRESKVSDDREMWHGRECKVSEIGIL